MHLDLELLMTKCVYLHVYTRAQLVCLYFVFTVFSTVGFGLSPHTQYFQLAVVLLYMVAFITVRCLSEVDLS